MPSTTFVSDLFNKIANKYDLLNNILSVGTHWIWKKKFVNTIVKSEPKSILDAATGTGDIAGLIHEKIPESHILGVDLSKNMIEVAKKKYPSINFLVSDINKLSDSYKAFDIACISFGIRNTEDTSETLTKLASYTRKKVFILEFGQPENFLFKKIYFTVMHTFIPLIGKVFRFKKSYKYLIESSESYPSGKEFIKIANDTKIYSNCHYKPLFGGICYIYELRLGE